MVAPKQVVDGASAAAIFKLLPEDGSLLFPEWIDFHLANNPDHPYCVLVGQGTDDDVVVTLAEAARASIRLAAQLRETIQVTEEQRKEGIRVAILANVDALTYCTMAMAIVRAGYAVFPLSIRNSVVALEHLISKTSSSFVFGSVPILGAPSSALQETTAEVLKVLPAVQLLDVPKYSDLYPRLASHPAKPYDSKEDKKRTPRLASVRDFPEFKYITKDTPVVILHSSGSTSFPKPIPFSHRYWGSVCTAMIKGDFEVTSTRWGLMGVPVFHGMGICLMVGGPCRWGTIPVLFKPGEKLIVPSPESVLEASKRSQIDYLIAVPSYCADWSRDGEAVKYLASVSGLIYGGGPLPQEAGDRLAQAGVKIGIAYGCTEIGIAFQMGFKREDPKDWNYGVLYPGRKMKLIPDANNMVRLVVMESEEFPIAESNQTDERAFDTNDLLEQHPTKKHLWRVVGRADDQIMMSNGEKTNPGPLENMIDSNPNIKACLMFGRARTQVGIAIEPADHVKVTNETELAQFRNLIWPDIEKANEFAPQHSRIFKEFIMVIDGAEKPFLRTPKGTISRNATLQQYAEEIDALYDAAEQPTKAEWAEPPKTWDEDALHAFVVRVVNGVMRDESQHHSDIDELRDLFEQGCDSLQATYIRAAITGALRQAPKPEGKSDIAATSVPQNLVFSYPTVRRLVSYMAKTVAAVGGHHVHDADSDSKVADMYSMEEKYSSKFPVHTPRPRKAKGEVVLLTGSTGTLGTYLLQCLLLDERVELVYAVNRGSTTHGLEARQRDAFVDRGVDVRLMDSPKLRLVETDVAKEMMGLSDVAYQEMCDSVSTIIHNAWRLDFNLSMSSFESNVAGSRQLVDLSLNAAGASPAQLIFTSSVGTIMKWNEPRAVPEEPLHDPEFATISGYSQSKWVAEHVMMAAAAERGLRATIWRVGQLAGSTANGAWNITDWLPLLVKSGERLRKLPSLPGNISWLPTNKAAEAIIDTMHATAPSPTGSTAYLHLVHPYPVSWDHMLQPLAKTVSSHLVPYTDWLRALEEAAEDPAEISRNPAIKLLDFFQNIGAGEGARQKAAAEGEWRSSEALGIADLETAKACEKSATLRGLKQLGVEDAERWTAYWKGKGLFA